MRQITAGFGRHGACRVNMSPCIPENSMPFRQKIKKVLEVSRQPLLRAKLCNIHNAYYSEENKTIYYDHQLWCLTSNLTRKLQRIQYFKKYNIKQNHKFNNISIFALLCPQNTRIFSSKLYQQNCLSLKNSNLHVLLQSALTQITSELFIKHQHS